MSTPSERYGPLVQTTLRIATWNVWWRFGDWQPRQEPILETLRAVDADIICLQEAWEWGDDSQPRAIAEALGMHWTFAARMDFAGQRFGNAILSRWPIAKHGHLGLPCPPELDEFRLAVYATIDGPRGPVDVHTTHVHYKYEHEAIRIDELRTTAQSVAAHHPPDPERQAMPPILCGDLNAPPNADCIRMLTGRAPTPVEGLSFFDAWEVAGDGPGFTWHNNNPLAAADLERNRRIDYVLVGAPTRGGRGHVTRCELFGVEPVDGVQPSDHYGVVADLRY